MNRLFCSIIDRSVLYNIHRVKSSKPQYADHQFVESGLEEIYPDPVVPEINFKANMQNGSYSSGEYTFMSPVKSDCAVNNRCMGEYFKNENSRSKEVSAILVHGWRAGDNHYMKDIYLKEFMRLGYNVYTYTLPYHFARMPEGSYNGEYLISANIERTISAAVQAVTELRALIHYLKTQKNSRIILIGNSLGGMVTNMTAVLEKNIDVLISIFYANSMAYSTFYSIAGKYVKKDLTENSNISFEELTKRWSVIIPSVNKPAIPKENILLISGKHDVFVLEEDTKALWEAWGKPLRLMYNCGHAGILLNRKAILRDSLMFICKRLSSV